MKMNNCFKTEIQFKSRWPLRIKVISLVVISTFLFRDLGWASYSYQDFQELQRQRERQRESQMRAQALQSKTQTQQNLVTRKNDNWNPANLIKNDYNSRLRTSPLSFELYNQYIGLKSTSADLARLDQLKLRRLANSAVKPFQDKNPQGLKTQLVPKTQPVRVPAFDQKKIQNQNMP